MVGAVAVHVTGLFGLVVVVCLYFLPTILAYNRKVPNLGSVMVINFFLGWTVIGWVVALAMAVRSVPSPAAAPMPVPAAPVSDTASRLSVAELERLTSLHATGGLTDDEFQQAKRQLLGS